uniref:Pept_C1 domain-containing protein n=1 Tax=Rhabditophanes sp. KR3021 TaxID=114890 RepID=A0AC35THA1_9BILA
MTKPKDYSGNSQISGCKSICVPIVKGNGVTPDVKPTFWKKVFKYGTGLLAIVFIAFIHYSVSNKKEKASDDKIPWQNTWTSSFVEAPDHKSIEEIIKEKAIKSSDEYYEGVLNFVYTPTEWKMLQNEFNKYKLKYNKRYSNYSVNQVRFRNFARNYENMLSAEERDDNHNVDFEENVYSDWSDKELNKRIMSKDEADYMKHYESEGQRNQSPESYDEEEGGHFSESYDEEDGDSFESYDEEDGHSSESYDEEEKEEEEHALPPRFDWREKGVVSAAKDQGECDCCAYFATVGVVESMNAITWNNSARLSEQELIDCDIDGKNDGCEGSYPDSIFSFIKKNGVAYEKYYKYRAERGRCKTGHGPRVHVVNRTKISTDENEMKKYLAEIGPFVVTVTIIREFNFYKSGVFDPQAKACKNRSDGLHAMMVVGYGTEKGEDYWLIKNSWGKSFGIYDGYIKWRRGVNACGISNHAWGVTVKKAN